MIPIFCLGMFGVVIASICWLGNHFLAMIFFTFWVWFFTVQDDASWNGRWSRRGPISQTNRRSVSDKSRSLPWFPWGNWPWGGIRHQRLGQKQRSAVFFFLKVFDIGKMVTCLVRFDSEAIDQVFSSTEYRVMWWTIHHRLNSNEPEEFRSFNTSLPRLCIQSRHFTVDNVTDADSLHLKSVKRHCGRGYVLVGHRKCAAFAVLKDDGAVATWGHPDCLVSCPHNRSRTLRKKTEHLAVLNIARHPIFREKMHNIMKTPWIFAMFFLFLIWFYNPCAFSKQKDQERTCDTPMTLPKSWTTLLFGGRMEKNRWSYILTSIKNGRIFNRYLFFFPYS